MEDILLFSSSKSKGISRQIYVAHLLGMWTKLFKSTVFNLLMFAIGMFLGMGFVLLHSHSAYKNEQIQKISDKLDQELVFYSNMNEKAELLMKDLNSFKKSGVMQSIILKNMLEDIIINDNQK